MPPKKDLRRTWPEIHNIVQPQCRINYPHRETYIILYYLSRKDLKIVAWVSCFLRLEFSICQFSMFR
jgi:hypothetical protein